MSDFQKILINLRKDYEVRKLTINLFICMKKKGVGYLCDDLFENVTMQIIYDDDENIEYSPGSFFDHVTRCIRLLLLEDLNSFHMTLFKSINLLQKKISTLTTSTTLATEQNQQFLENQWDTFKNRQQSIMSQKDQINILRPFSQSEILYHMPHSFVIKVPNFHFQNYVIPHCADYASHFSVHDPYFSCERVYIEGYPRSFARDFTWDKDNLTWDLDIFKPPYSPLYMMKCKFNVFRIYFEKKLDKGVTISVMYHYLDQPKRRVLAVYNLKAIYDETHYLQYSGGETRLIPKLNDHNQ